MDMKQTKSVFAEIEGFDWDDGNVEKNQEKHGVSWKECEEVFLRKPLIVSEDVGHSQREKRFRALGQTDMGRKLFLVFTIRSSNIRIISARDMSRKERYAYEKTQEDSSV